VPHTPLTGRLGRLSQTRSADDPELAAVREAVRAQAAEHAIRKAIQDAPPLPAETRARLAEILTTPPARDGAA